MIKINSRECGDMWINHKHIVSVSRYQPNPTLWTTRIVTSNGNVILALDDCPEVLNRIEEAKQKEIELRRF